MTLYELSNQYKEQVDVLKARIQQLEENEENVPEDELGAWRYRIHMLTTMRREARELANLCEGYYERGYHKHAKYSI